MAASGLIMLSGAVSGGPDGQRTFGPLSITSSAAVMSTTIVTLSVGANTVTVPNGATAVMVCPPNSTSPTPNPQFAGTLTLKGVTGDTGVVVSNKWQSVIAWDTAPATFVITSTATGSLELWWM